MNLLPTKNEILLQLSEIFRMASRSVKRRIFQNPKTSRVAYVVRKCFLVCYLLQTVLSNSELSPGTTLITLPAGQAAELTAADICIPGICASFAKSPLKYDSKLSRSFIILAILWRGTRRIK